MRKVSRIGEKSSRKRRVVSQEEYKEMGASSRLDLIEALIPVGLMAVAEELQGEVKRLAGERYSRGSVSRHGTNRGSVVLGGQRMAIDVPRVRDGVRGCEVPLTSYQRLHHGGSMEEAALLRVLKGLSCREYREAAMAVPEAFGLSSSNVSRQFIRASGQKLQELMERDLSSDDMVAMLIDGKSFAQDNLLTAVGVTLDGRRIILGFTEAATENARVTGAFLQSLLDRGLKIDEGILVVVDGSKGLICAITQAMRGKVLIQRCQWHKRENVVEYVSQGEQPFLRRRLQKAYERPTEEEARGELLKIRKDLEQRNLSAVRSLDEGFEETLTLHQLGLFPLLGRSLKTTNGIESIHALVQRRCGRVTHWKNSSQRQRWLAATLLDLEPRLNRICGYRHLWKLREALKRELNLNNNTIKEAA